MIRFLLSYGAGVNEKNEDDLIPLHQFVYGFKIYMPEEIQFIFLNYDDDDNDNDDDSLRVRNDHQLL